jgi:hypothetical protein
LERASRLSSYCAKPSGFKPFGDEQYAWFSKKYNPPYPGCLSPPFLLFLEIAEGNKPWEQTTEYLPEQDQVVDNQYACWGSSLNYPSCSWISSKEVTVL